MPTMPKKPDHRPANDVALSSLVSEHPRAVHIERSDEKFAASMRLRNEKGRLYGLKFNELILKDERIEDCPPADVQILDVTMAIPKYEVLRELLQRHWDLDLYHMDRLIDDYSQDEDAGVFSLESRNLIPFGPSVIIITYELRKRENILIDAEEALGFQLQRHDRIFHQRPHF